MGQARIASPPLDDYKFSNGSEDSCRIVATGARQGHTWGVFVTFEGPEGAGKSTAIKAVGDRLVEEGRAVVLTREPGAGEVGQKIRQILLEGEGLDSRCELFLFLADRAQHVAKLVRPALENGKIVLCDRYGDSTVVYQGVGRGLDADEARRLNELATGGLRPDLTILLDLDPQVGLGRVAKPNRLDREPLEFHQAVRQGFLEEARREPARWVIVDACLQPGEVAAACISAVQSRLAARPPG